MITQIKKHTKIAKNTGFLKFRLYIIVLLSIALPTYAKAQEPSDDLINLLLKNQVINQKDADSLKSEQTKKLKNESFTVDFEFRPRTELRNGFRQLRADTTRPAFATSQRSRLSLAYKRERLAVIFSIQDIRLWGAADPRSTGGTVQVFEAYGEPYITKNFSIRVGKQRVMYDNQRLFAQNDWRQNGGTHDAINFRYYKNRFEGELVFAFNQSSEPLYFTYFNPVGFTNYKTLGVSYLKYKTKNEKWAFTTINYFDGYQVVGSENSEKQNFRYTDGGRIEFLGKIYATISGYYQYGKNPSTGQNLSAFYFQPEIKTVLKDTELRLGAEVKSGNDPSNKNTNTDHRFQYPYGVAHRFNGTMEYFASGYPGSKKDVGLINPYFFIEQKIGKKFALSLQNHLFWSQYKSLDANKNPSSKFLGFENDFLLIYRPNSYTKVDWGISLMTPTASMENITGGNYKLTPYWSYLQITINPRLLTVKR